MIGIDVAKNCFQLYGARSDGSVAFRKKLSRGKVLEFLASKPDGMVAMPGHGHPERAHACEVEQALPDWLVLLA